MSKPRIIVAYGTRPEAIKLAPVIDALRARGAEVVEWCSGQSSDLVGSVGGAMPGLWDTGLTTGVAGCIEEFGAYLAQPHVDAAAVVVQGDTATAFACAQAAFLAGVPVAHVEAGLRTYAAEPWPEEAFRRQIAAVARWHFCPDETAARNIAREQGEHERVGLHALPGVAVVGNPVIDTLPRRPFRVLATLHRRENWGERRQRALRTLIEFGHCNEGVEVTILRHPNGTTDYDAEMTPEEQKFWLRDPLPHDEMLRRIADADLVVTDSGGLQEEAAHFGIPCLVLRTSTERVALERSGAVTLVDPDCHSRLRNTLQDALERRFAYGRGDAGAQIAEILLATLDNAASGA